MTARLPALALGSVLLALVALEVGLRLAGWDAELQSAWMLGNQHLVLDPDVIIIQERLLDPAFYAPPTAPMVLAIGDSFTSGFPVAARHSYPALLQRLLAQHGIVVDVRNAGMGDSGPDQQLRLLTTRLLPKLHPAVVVWQLYANDVWDEITKGVYGLEGERLVPLPADRHWIAVRQRVFAWTPLPQAVKQKSRVVRLVLRAVERATRPEPHPNPVDWSLAKIARALDEFERLAVVHGFRPYVVLVPPQTLFLPPHDPDVVRQGWSLADHERMATLVCGRTAAIDVAAHPFGDADFADAAHDPQPRGLRHFSARGYARLATLVAHRLGHDGVAPQVTPAALADGGAPLTRSP